MKLESFEYLINKIKEASERENSFYSLGLDIQNISDPYHQIITHLIRVYYGKEGEDWISWYLYEKNGREDMKAWDKDRNEICYDIPSLWKEVEEIRVSIDFEEYTQESKSAKENILEFLSKFKNNEL